MSLVELFESTLDLTPGFTSLGDERIILHPFELGDDFEVEASTGLGFVEVFWINRWQVLTLSKRLGDAEEDLWAETMLILLLDTFFGKGELDVRVT